MGIGKLEFASIEKTANAISPKFSVVILASLFQTRTGRGFNALLKELPTITPRTLSQRLKELEQKGLISKNISMGPRIRIEYRLTDRGFVFEDALNGLAQTGVKL